MIQKIIEKLQNDAEIKDKLDVKTLEDLCLILKKQSSDASKKLDFETLLKGENKWKL